MAIPLTLYNLEAVPNALPIAPPVAIIVPICPRPCPTWSILLPNTEALSTHSNAGLNKLSTSFALARSFNASDQSSAPTKSATSDNAYLPKSSMPSPVFNAPFIKLSPKSPTVDKADNVKSPKSYPSSYNLDFLNHLLLLVSSLEILEGVIL